MSCRKWEVQILRWQEGTLDQVAEVRLLRHVGSCIHCRSLAEKFSELDGLFLKSQEPSLPPFLKERIVSTLSEAMREDSMRGAVSRFSTFLATFLVSFRPAVAAAVLVLGIGLGVVTAWNLAQSVSRDATGSSYDLLSLAGFGGAGSGSSLEFIWTDSNGRTGQ